MSNMMIFVDFWNFQLDWNDLVGRDANNDRIKIPWRKLPDVIGDAISKKRGEPQTYSGTSVYASVNPKGDPGLKNFLHRMDSFPGYSVLAKERVSRRGNVRCNREGCKQKIDKCPSCNQKLRKTVEKGVDTALLTDMIQMAHDDIYDVGVLASTDADFCKAVEFIQKRLGKNIYNLWFPGLGDELRNTCWDHLIIPNLLTDFGISSAA